MKKYKVNYTPKVIKQIKKLDMHTRRLIYSWISKNLVDCENPRIHGKRSSQWRYRIGDYRLICEINDEEIVVLVLAIGHRREIYD